MSEPEKNPESESPSQEGHKSLKEKFVEGTKVSIKSWFIGTAAFFSLGLIGLIGSAIGVQELNFRTISSVNDIVVILSQLNWQTALFIIFSAAAVGGVLWFWISASIAIGKLVHEHKLTKYSNPQVEKEISKDLRKLRILPLATFGVFMAIMILPVAGGIYALTGINVTNAHSLIGAYTGGHYLVILIVAVGGAVTGAIMQHFKGEYQKTFDKIQRNIPKKLDRIL